MKILARTFKLVTTATLLSISLSACGGMRPPLGPGLAYQQSDFGNLQGQTAVPNEFLIKRNGAGYISYSPEEFAQQLGIGFVREIKELGVELYQINDPNVIEMMREMIEYAEPNYLRHLSMPDQQAASIKQQSVFHRQNGAAGDSLPAANNYIGIIDTGVDAGHADLQGKLLPGHNTLGQDDINDDNGHGTFLAGLVVAENPSQSIDGVLPGGKILPIKALDKNGIGTDFSIAEGIIKAVEYGSQVIVLSATGANQSQALQAAMDYANQRNVPIVVPAGNQMDAASVFPGSSRSVIAVNSVDSHGQNLSRFSRQSQNVTISAVSEGLRSTLPMRSFSLGRLGLSSGYGQLETPGAAAVQVASAIAAIKALRPGIRLPEIRQHLMASADDLGAQGMDAQFGSGRLNLQRLPQVSAQSLPAQGRPQALQAYPQQPTPYNAAQAPRYSSVPQQPAPQQYYQPQRRVY